MAHKWKCFDKEFMPAMKWGIIGPGDIAEEFFKDLKLVKGDQRVTAILGHRQETTTQFATKFNVEFFTTELDDFINKSKIDIAYIATPHPQHFEEALACLENKIAVLCEKPLTLNVSQAERLIEASRKNKTFLMEGMWLRFLPSIAQVLKLVQEGAIGKIISVHASMAYKAPKDPTSRYYDPKQGGGSLLDLGIYPIFLSQLMLGTPNSIKAIGLLSDQGIDTTCSTLLKYGNGAYAMLESSLLSEIHSPAQITGEKGTIKILDPWYEKSKGIELERYNEGKIVYPCAWQGHGLQFEAQHVLECLLENKIESPLLSHDFSLSTQRILAEIREQIHVKYEMYE